MNKPKELKYSKYIECLEFKKFREFAEIFFELIEQDTELDIHNFR